VGLVGSVSIGQVEDRLGYAGVPPPGDGVDERLKAG